MVSWSDEGNAKEALLSVHDNLLLTGLDRHNWVLLGCRRTMG